MTKPAVPKVPSVRRESRLGPPLSSLRWWVRVHAKALGLLSVGGAGVAAGGAAAGLIGALVAGALVLATGKLLILYIPVAGFIRDQQTLTEKGQQVATTAAEVCAIMNSHAVAYGVG